MPYREASVTEQFPPFGYPGAQPAAGPAPKARRRRRTALIAGGSAIVLAIAGVVTYLAWPGAGEAAVPHGPAALAATFGLPGTDTGLYALFSPDGRLLAIQGRNNNDKNLYIWDTATHTYRATLTAPSGEVSTIGFSADDTQVTTTSTGGAVLRWNLATGAHSVITPIRSTSPEGLSGDGNILAAQDSAGHGIGVWDLRTGRLIADLPNPVAGTLGITTMDNTGQTLVVSSQSRMYVWDVPSRKVIATLRYPSGKNFQEAFPVLTADGKDIGLESLDNSMPVLLNVATQSDVTPLDARWPRKHATVQVQLSTAGAICATQGSNDEHIDLWNIATRSYLLTVGSPSRHAGSLAALGPTGHELLTSPGADGHTFDLWDIP
jgi:WD40 repeat protein